MSDLIKNNDLDLDNYKDIDLLQVDAEGYDDEIIYNSQIDFFKPKYINFEYKSVSRKSFEKILKSSFSKIKKVDGIPGADVTKNTFSNDKYLKRRFGSGNLRYLCVK